MTTKLKFLVTASVLAVILTAGSVVRAEEIYSGGATVNIDREVNGFLQIDDATVNLLKNAHIKNGEYYGDIYANSGCVLNIYGGVIDGYLSICPSYTGFPEAIVTVYGYDFAVDGVPVAEGKTEVFLPDYNILSGYYQDGTPFSHMVTCYWDDFFYLTVKLGWITSKPQMTVTPQSLDFGQVKVGRPATQTVTIANTGNANLQLQTVSLAGDSNPGFSFTPLTQLPMTIEPGAAVSVDVIFTPTAAGAALGMLKITGDDTQTPVSQVVLTGVGIIPEIAAELVSLDFGSIDIGTSAAQSLTIANHGAAQLMINSIAWTEDSSADFAVAVLPELPLVIEPNGIVELSVVYTPTTIGAAAAALAVSSDDPENPLLTLTMTGIGVYPPLRQINDIIAFYDQSVQNGTIVGVGPGKSAQAHIKVIKEALLVTKCLIQSKYQRLAIVALLGIDKFTDGDPKQKDLITGPAVAELNTKINTLITTLKTR